ncbi:ABC transporter permease [Colwellia psychrerythraea]|uniref:MacB-like periplasmic core domain containing protein n=1 Tax=Colwellia psychrerythraea TaxID=28229 RepID=A0A099KT31_COLPS|nr:ABC transporter permease [Colwellia psychrerythraea]KGJ92828.1 MacB-like periplasmic core domain containing protein [Colwellia psychrerythraea]
MNLFFSSLSYSVKQAYKSLQQTPSFVFSVITTMSITLGALLCVLTLAYVMLFKPLPYPDAEHLVKVDHIMTKKDGSRTDPLFSYPSMMYLVNNQTLFSDIALSSYDKQILTSHTSQPTMLTTYVTPAWFELFQVPMELGRAFAKDVDIKNDVPEAVLSFDTWQQAFNNDENIIGKTVRFRDVSFKVIGVSAQSFIEPQLIKAGYKSQVWLTWDFNRTSARARKDWGSINENLIFVAKLDKNNSTAQAEQQLSPSVNAKWQEGVASDAFYDGWRVDIQVSQLKSAILSNHQQSVLLLLAGVFGLVLIACSNIANLFIARMAQLQKTLAISAAVGAKKSQLFKLLLAESSLLMFASLMIALIFASVGFVVLQQNLAQVFPRVDEVVLSTFTLSSAILFATMFTLFFALLGNKMINYRAISQHLHGSGKGVDMQISKKVRYSLIVSQVAIASVLVFGNLSLFTEALKVINEPVGVNTANFVDIDFSTKRRPTQEEIDGPVLGTAIKNSLLALPQVAAVSNSQSPLSGFYEMALTNVATNEHMLPGVKWIDESYFQLIEQPLLAGDYFTVSDIREGFTGPEGKIDNMVMIINDTLAKKVVPQGASLDYALGKKFKMDERGVFTVIGIVKGMKMPGVSNIPVRAYVPSSVHSISMTVKLKPNQTLSREQVITAVNEVTSLFALFSMKDVAEIHQQLLFSERATAITTGTLALLTILLAALGLYGILSYSTQMRRYEIGTRLALGAKRRDIVNLIVFDNLIAVIIGIIISIVILIGLMMAFNEQLESIINVSLLPLFLLTLLLISGIAFNACYLPLRTYINKPALYSLRGSE